MASTNPSLGRYGKPPGRGGYNPPVYGGGGGGGGGDYYGQNDRNREEGESIVFFKDFLAFCLFFV